MTPMLGAALGLPAGIGLAAPATSGLHSCGLRLSVPVPSLAGKLNVLAALEYE